jgi:putative DNA primase/helicase
MSRPVITLVQGQLPWIVDAAEAAILPNHEHWGIYQRAGNLVRVVIATAKDDPKGHVRRPPGAVILRGVTSPMLQDIFGRAIDWQIGEGKKARSIDCPAKVGNIYLSRAGLWRLRTLVGFVEAPVMRDDGSLLIEPAYDESTELLLQTAIAWGPPPSLSREAVQAAVRCLLTPLAEFPLSDAGRSVVISAILTGLQRRLLFSAPAHGIDAPTQGSGKSLIADCVAIIVTGRRATTTSVNKDRDQEELRKKLVSLLIAGDPVVNLDTSRIRSAATRSQRY